MERRTFLSASGASVLAFAAARDFASHVSNGPKTVVKEYYRRAAAAETARAFASSVPELAHSASPLPKAAEDIPRTLDGALNQEVAEIEVVAEDIDAQAVREVSDFFAGSVSDEAVKTIAEDNAVVAVALETDEVVGRTFAKEWLVAPEDGEWRLVWFGERDSPEAAVREFFRQVALAETFEALDEPVADLSHSASPLVNVAEYTPWYFRGLRRQELDRTEVVTEDVESAAIASEFTSFVSWTSRDAIEDIAGENAVVATSLSDDQLGIETFEQRWLVAPEYGEWRVVWF
ncbi:hypothetical protein C475_07470 [Halosimplex carlsbadense 2-9-1]|uniref:Uncharacterized protein n=1 Tax=Halosimplex carlsbadense 2-9-1 TaxID=797114 RepID=M0CZ72_9EURY|nr:hypothetical protein [Halosimplex carlsbadense]ELZ27742.1 hypothetical protein C475_07470 [Halosimplex carlsbadense 2-9-1]